MAGIVIYGYIDENGEHVNLDRNTLEGCPIQPILNFPNGEPAAVQYFISAEQADWYYYSMLNRYLAFSEQFDKLSLVPLLPEWLENGNYKLVPALTD